MQILEENFSDPEQFPDMFDATIPMADRKYIDYEYLFFFYSELAYKVLMDISEEGEVIPDKSSLLDAMHETMEKYSQEEIDARLIEVLGHEDYQKMRNCKLPDIDFTRQIERTKRYLDNLSASPRNSLTIASFTTKYDNQNMWENYAENYTGFCVEYCFSGSVSPKSAWDILHLLPVKYFRKRPLFNYTEILRCIVQADMTISTQTNSLHSIIVLLQLSFMIIAQSKNGDCL